MKFIDRIIEDIPMLDIEKAESKYHNECNYLADSRVILDNLREYEVEIPKEYFETKIGIQEHLFLLFSQIITRIKMNDFTVIRSQQPHSTQIHLVIHHLILT